VKSSSAGKRETRRLSEWIRANRKVQTPGLRKSPHGTRSLFFSQVVHKACQPVISAKPLKRRGFENEAFHSLILKGHLVKRLLTTWAWL
jgi:hypothetical protein